jgi:azurin
MFKALLPALAGVLLLSACGGNNNQHQHDHDAADKTSPSTAASEINNTIELSGGDDMKFNRTNFTVAVNKPVKLTLTHSGKMDRSVMGHNFVLLKPLSDVMSFAGQAVNAKETDYVPANDDKVIAFTKLLGGGESQTIEFVLTEKGTYPFLCSFPGHAGVMRGVILAE